MYQSAVNPLELRKFFAPEVVTGLGARHLAGRYANGVGAHRVLLVTDPGVREVGWADNVADSLQEAGIEHVVFDRVTPNPRDTEVMAGAEVYRAEGCNALIAVGGGSPMDCAKGIGIVAANNGAIGQYAGADRVPRPMPPLVCVPTTAGTSADVSQFAIIRDSSARVKLAIVSKAVVPDVSLLDPETLTTMDAELTAHTGLDALTHAIEALMSNAASETTDIHAVQAIGMIASFLEQTLNRPTDLHARAMVMFGSMYAGFAFSNASLGATHAIAHGLGGLLDLPHGVCNALMIAEVLRFNAVECEQQCRSIGEAFGLRFEDTVSPGEIGDAIAEWLNDFRASLGVAQRLADLGITEEDLKHVSRAAAADACLATNPRCMSVDDLEMVCGRAF